jgi:uncharacterized protein YcfJ
MNEPLPSSAGEIQYLGAMMTYRNAVRTTAGALGMNRNATAALALLLASVATIGIWRLGWNGPPYARVTSTTPVTVREPRYADVVESVRVPGAASWDVAYRSGPRIVHLRLSSEPGDQVRVGDQKRVIGYDVAWRWRERTGVIRMASRPGKRLPVVDGSVVETRRPGVPPG